MNAHLHVFIVILEGGSLLCRQLEATRVISGNPLHALARPARQLQGSAAGVFMDKQFQVREYVMYMVQFEVNNSVLATVHAQ